ncbi:unnamed protein product [Ambrosiozyma monospora]|uniref:Unnamed protein product n=1 Tax=Ambrosiozyma monospora TaxID=43982 RepID=A0ACB5SX13_AMBMO|nr:unnamed protein product [Ambrosiozyma monospora]
MALGLKFSFPDCPSKLKILSIDHASLSPINFESIPDELHELRLSLEQAFKNEDIKRGLKLPVGLRNLSIMGCPNHWMMHTFTNIEQLFDLEKVTLHFYYNTSIHTIENIKSFFSRLPVNSLTCLSVGNIGYIGDDAQSFCYSDKLKFDRFPKLTNLTIDCFSGCKNTSNFNMFLLPNQLDDLIWDPHDHTLTDQFPSNLRSLDFTIEDSYQEVYEPFRVICNTFLGSLENLRILKVRTNALHSLDLRNVQLPKHLTSFKLFMGAHMSSCMEIDESTFVVLDSGLFSLDSDLNFICFDFGMAKYTIVVDYWTSAGVESIKSKIQVDGLSLPTWVLCDHEYSLLENNLF